MIKIVGFIKEEDIYTISGLATLYFSDGLPLSIIFDRLKDTKFKPSWIHLFNELKDNGMNNERIFHLLHEQIFESYGKEYRDIILNKLWQIVNKTS